MNNRELLSIDSDKIMSLGVNFMIPHKSYNYKHLTQLHTKIIVKKIKFNIG